jgi:hypothetical protein
MTKVNQATSSQTGITPAIDSESTTMASFLSLQNLSLENPPPQTTPPPGIGPFLGHLPREIRDQIYSLVVVRQQWISITDRTQPIHWPRNGRKYQFAILWVSKIVRDETIEVLLRQNKIDLVLYTGRVPHIVSQVLDISRHINMVLRLDIPESKSWWIWERCARNMAKHLKSRKNVLDLIVSI